jgi:hypothetical protein
MNIILKSLCAAGLLFGVGVGAAPQPAPKLVCAQPSFDFGERESSGELDHTFVIRNAGNVALQILGLRPTCGCLVPKFTDRILAPGAEATITVRFVLRGRQGEQKKIVYIESNDPVTPSFALHMTGVIVDPVDIEPRLLFFGRVPASFTATNVIVVTAAGTNQLGEVSAQLDSPAFTVTTEPLVAHKSARVIVISKPPLPEGLTRASLRISTGNPRLPTITSVVSAFVPGAFAVTPPELLLVGREGDRIRREIILRHESNLTFRVLAVEPPLKEIVYTIVPTNNAVRLEFPGLPVLRSLEGKQIRIVTDLPTRPEVLVPLRVFIR